MPSKIKSFFGDRIGATAVIIGGVISLVASFVLSIENLFLAANDGAKLGCDINSIFSCSVVAQDASASLLGFPNSFVGMMALPLVVMVGVIWFTQTKLPGWMEKAITLGVIAGLIFACWMFYQSFFVINVLCPWCLATDFGMLCVSYGAIHYQSRAASSFTWVSKLRPFSEKGYDLAAVLGIIVLACAAIILKFGDALL